MIIVCLYILIGFILDKLCHVFSFYLSNEIETCVNEKRYLTVVWFYLLFNISYAVIWPFMLIYMYVLKLEKSDNEFD